MNDKNVNKVMGDEEVTYIVDDKVIDDTLCPKCMERISSKTEFCTCGFYVKASKNSEAFSFVFFMIVIVAVVALFFTRTDLLPSIGNKAATKFTKKSMGTTASPIIMVEDHLKDSGLIEKIRDLYQQPKDKNILMIVVKPEYWSTMKSEEKKYILSSVKSLWKTAYRGEDPQAEFANPQ
ncbi:MAG: hypothetical protein AB1782_12905 [Cyanobacteriota bacterium]